MIALVLDGQLQSALAAVRSLGEKGIKVICGSSSKTAMSLYSKFCYKKFFYISPKKDKYRFLADLKKLAKSIDEEILVYCFSDETFLPVSEHRKFFPSNLKIIAPAQDNIEIAFSKEKTLRLAQELGIEIPETFFLKSAEEINELKNKLEFPIIIKPRHSCFWHFEKGFFGGVSLASSYEDLLFLYDKITKKMKEGPLVQKFIPGEEFGVFYLMNHGDVLASFAHKRIRSISPIGGASAVRESIEMPEDMEYSALRLLKRLDWHGAAMVEFKREVKSGQPVLMEINGRFWGSLPLAVFSGVDFPFLYFQLANGQIKKNEIYRKGIVARHFLADTKNLISIIFGKRIKGLPYPTSTEAIKNYFKFFNKNLFYDVESFSDPLPFFMEVIDSLIRLKK